MMNKLDQGSLEFFRGAQRCRKVICRQAVVLWDIIKNYQDGKIIVVPDVAVSSHREFRSTAQRRQ